MDDAAAAPSILIVDDHDEFRAAVARILAHEGYAVAQATNGAEALSYLRAHPAPRLIILDLLMPVMDGWQFHRALLGDPALAAIPVLITSERAYGEDADLAGAAYLRKPFDLTSFLALVSRRCR